MSNSGFNLLKPQLEPPTVWTKIYDWIVGTARLIVIVVEIIVVVAFGIRLILDIQGNKLSEDIENSEATLRAFQSSEARYKQTQNKTRAFNISWVEAPVFTDIYVEVNSYIPDDAIELNVQITSSVITISGKASINEIGDMETSFKNSPTFIDSELVQLESSGGSSNQFAEFTLRTKIKSIKLREIPEVAQDNQ